MAKIAVLGYGVVGSGTVELFYKNKDSIIKKAGKDLDIKYILDIREFPGSPYESKFTKNIDDILNDSEVTLVAEVMGGVHPAFDFVKACLEKGKSVVTSNKELVAKKGAELLKTADVIVAAVGKACFVKPDMVKEGVVIVDVGINAVGDKLMGDVDPAVAEKASAFTPVPGGIGVVSNMMVMECLTRNL